MLFPNLSRLIPAIFSISHSNAETEHSFSDVNLVKDELSSRTGIELLNARCFLRAIGKAYGFNSSNFNPTEEHFQLFNSKNMY